MSGLRMVKSASLMASPNCMDENGMQVKLGLVRLHFEPDVFEKDFKQELHLERSEIVVSGKTASVCRSPSRSGAAWIIRWCMRR